MSDENFYCVSQDVDPPDPAEYRDDPEPLLCGGAGEIEHPTWQDRETGVWETEIHPCPGCRECEGGTR